jgi:hypothetical protein
MEAYVHVDRTAGDSEPLARCAIIGHPARARRARQTSSNLTSAPAVQRRHSGPRSATA